MWKSQLAIANNFISFIDNDEEHVLNSTSDNIEIIINDDADEVMKEHFDSLNIYQNNWESIRGWLRLKLTTVYHVKVSWIWTP